METIQGMTSDGIGGSKYDACQTISNGSQLNGKIALIERGDCHLLIKLRRAQQCRCYCRYCNERNDGSQADWSSAPITMGGSNAEDISIPSVMISSTDGTRLNQDC